MTEILNLSRRGFLRGTALGGGGLVLASLLPAESAHGAAAVSPIGSLIRIGTDGGVTIFIEKCEMGQGVYTSLPILVAEELDADWQDVRVESPPREGAERWVATAGSSSVRRSWEPLRRAGAAAREMLAAAAAEVWGVPRSECTTARGRVTHVPTARTLAYAELAERAALLPVPESAALKAPSERRLIGRQVPRLDIPDKVSGRAVFGIDVERPGALQAAIRMSPVLGGRLVGYDEKAALALRGVRAVVEVPQGVAVVADHYWQADKGLEALAPVFEGGDEKFSSEDYSARLRQALREPGVVTHEQGDPGEVFGGATGIVEAEYEVPFLAHVTMEPINCTAEVTGGRCEIWAPTQGPSKLRAAVAEALEMPLQRVRVHTTLLGGGFGRRFEADFGIQAALLAKAVERPVKLIWSRQEDLRHDFYRPAYAARLRAVVDARGEPTAWGHHVAGPWFKAQDAPSWLRRSVAALQLRLGSGLVPEWTPDVLEYLVPGWMRTGGDGLAVGGAGPLSYRAPHQRVEYTPVDANVPVGWWRSVGHSQNGFFTESFVDELAHAAGRDPYEYRRALLAERERRVLDRAAEAANWRGTLPAGWGRGIAFRFGFGSSVCQVAEVSVSSAQELRVHRVVCAVDCGQVVSHDGVRAQLEGAIISGLGAALHGEITFRGGAVVEGSLHDYRLLKIGEIPEIETHIIESEASPGGMGEVGLPPIAPALANAVFAATGRRIRKLPLRKQLALPATS
jgi:CO/xanthine dehydrogenase Mo-binding subunit